MAPGICSLPDPPGQAEVTRKIWHAAEVDLPPEPAPAPEPGWFMGLGPLPPAATILLAEHFLAIGGILARQDAWLAFL